MDKTKVYIYSLKEFLEHRDFNIEINETDGIKEFETYYPDLVKGVYNEKELLEYSNDMFSIIGNLKH